MIAINDAELWVSSQGSGEPLVLYPGGPGCCDYLGPVATMMDDLVQVHRVEPRGCGRSSQAGPFDVATSLRDLEALRVHLGHDRWIVGGHSHGAFMALAYAVAWPERTKAVVYLAGTGIQDDRQWHRAYEAGRDAGNETEIAFAFPPNMEVNRVANASAREAMKQPMLLRQLADLTVPVLVVQGSEDIRPNWPAIQLANLLPNARLAVIDGAGHNLWLTHAGTLRAELRAFLRDMQAPPGVRRGGPQGAAIGEDPTGMQ